MVTDSALILYISIVLLYIQSYKDRGRADRDNLAVTCPAMLYLSALADEQRTRHSRRFYGQRALWGIFRFLDEFSRGVEDTNIKQISCGPKHSSQSGGKLLHVTADVVYPTKPEALLISVEVR